MIKYLNFIIRNNIMRDHKNRRDRRDRRDRKDHKDHKDRKDHRDHRHRPVGKQIRRLMAAAGQAPARKQEENVQLL